MANQFTIGLVTGIHGIVATYVKSALLAAARQLGKDVRLVECDWPMPLEAPSTRHAWADRKLTALEAALRLQEQKVDVIVVGDYRSEPFIAELRNEVQTPILSFFEEAKKYIDHHQFKRIGLVGNVLPVEFFKTRLPNIEFIEAEGADPRVNTDDITTVREYADRLADAGCDIYFPNCGRMAGVVPKLTEYGYPFLDLFHLAAESLLKNPPSRYPKPFKVGLVGGLGPAATVDLYDKLVRFTPAHNDQEHFRVSIEQNPQTPDRTKCLLENGEDPSCALFASARRLEHDGCDAIIIPCNTAHAFLPFLERHINVPFINMQQSTMEEIHAKMGDKAVIGLLATTGTVKTGLYGDKARSLGMPLYAPDDAHQALVMDAIYGPDGVKAGFTTGKCRDELLKAAQYLVDTYGCNCLILGCTELPLILDEADDFEIGGKHVRITDPTSALARKVVQLALETNRARGITTGPAVTAPAAAGSCGCGCAPKTGCGC